MNLKNTKLLIIFLVLLISVGFAYLTANLAINASVGFKESTWDVHLDSIEVNENSYDLTKPIVDSKNTSLTFNVTLNEPGDFYEFTVDIVNAGTMDAALDGITKSTLDETKSKNIDYSVRYYGNRAVKVNDILHAGYKEKLIVRVEYKYDINTLEHLGDVDFSLDLDYVKRDLDYDYGEEVWNIDYSGKEFVYNVPKTGEYRLEIWGAQGGFAKAKYSEIGGYGGYSIGTVSLSKKDVLYINVGEEGHAGTLDYTTTVDSINEGTRSYNGGGNSSSNVNCKFAGGGGATHIATVSGELADLNSYMGILQDNMYYASEEILIVAGGGGGAATFKDYVKKGGSAGGYIGSSGSNMDSITGIIVDDDGKCADAGNGGTQIGSGNGGFGQKLGSFGKGGYSKGSGGGGGFFGGNGAWNCGSPGGGGSSYIGSSKLNEKSMYCYMCQESEEENIKTISTTEVSDEPISAYAKIGNGFARITYLG